MRICDGSTAEDEIDQYLHEFDAMMEAWELNDGPSADYRFFDNGKFCT
jgi:hypothetical protein